MRKKISSALTIILLALLCLGLFVSCAAKTVNIFEYSADNIGLVGKLVMAMHKWIGNYGWTVVVFTLFLKIIMLPIDFWQRYSSRKSTLKMQKLQPVLEEIDKRYGANTPRSNEEKQKLYKKQGTSMFGMCLPMILSMAIFFVMFAGLRNYSTYSSVQTFNQLSQEYYQVYAVSIGSTPELEKDADINSISSPIAQLYVKTYRTESERYRAQQEEKLKDGEKVNETAVEIYARAASNKAIASYSQECIAAHEVAVEAVQKKYAEIKESWLWIQNVWQPDTWDSIMPTFSGGANSFESTINMDGFPDDTNGKDTYNVIRNAVLATGERGSNGSWNGLMILPILSIALSFLSMFISQLMEKKNRKGEVVQNKQQAATNKVMMIMMPLMMAYFGFIYTGAFAIYMVVNYAVSILATVGLRFPVEKLVEKNLAKAESKEKSGKASYMR